MSLRQTIIANYIGSGATLLAPILALPWYLAALGPQQFGLLAFVTTIQALLNLLDAGMSQALVRELSISFHDKHSNPTATATLLFNFERIYWLLAVGVGCVVFLLSHPITTQWLKLDVSLHHLGFVAIYGAAAIFTAMFPGSLYRSLLVSCDRQVTLNKITVAAAVVRHLGGVLTVLQWPTLTAYVLWHLAAALAETGTRAYFAWETTGVKRRNVHWQNSLVKRVFPGIAGLAAASGLGALTMQLDKLLLSHLTSMENFGYYVISASLAGGLLQIIYPVMQAALPKAIQLRNDRGLLKKLYTKITLYIFLIIISGILIYGLFGNLLVEIWLKNPTATSKVYPLLGLMLAGAALNGLYNLGYMHWLVNGNIRRILYVNILNFILCLALIPLMVTQFGTIGATSAWVIINIIGLTASLPSLSKIFYEK